MADTNASKVGATHLKRDAFLYVRQSTLQQLVHNTESAQRQYDLRQRAIALGWSADKVHVIDCDLGQSGASASDRAGFQQLVSEVSLGHAGIVLGLEVSRLARNSTDWHRLMELCAMSDTLILDEDGLYDCNDFNDRLILGMKGTISEVELHYIRARLRGGIVNKAKRGELMSPLPVGLVYDDAQRVQLDPDAQVQAAIRLLFATFRRTGTARATLKYFRDNKLLFPRRLRAGVRMGELIWADLCHSRILQVLHNPRYAGAFSFGRTKMRVGPNGKVQYNQKNRSDWIALIPDAHPGYIRWEEYEDNQQRLLENAQREGRDRRKSPPGEGPALLQGLVICGVCGRRMTVRYHNRHGQLFPDYNCGRSNIELNAPRCQSIPGYAIDQAISNLVLDTVNPVSAELALAVQQEICVRQQEALALRMKQVARSQYEADLARQRYMRCDPNNRLVASNLEADWNQALRNLDAAQEELEKQRRTDRFQITDEVRARIAALTVDFPALWRDAKTTDRDRKRLIRLLIEDVTLLRNDRGITLQIRFRGGATKTLTLSAPQTAWQARTTRPDVITQIDILLNEHTDGQVAAILNQQGLRSGTGKLFSARIIAKLRKAYDLQDRYARLRARGFLTLAQIARRLGVSTSTVKIWRRLGLLHSHAYSDKPECLYEVPSGEPLPTKRQGCKLKDRPPVTNIIPIRSKKVYLET
jgi:DNA invertase Pin-like site-specific DNA recombinase